MSQQQRAGDHVLLNRLLILSFKRHDEKAQFILILLIGNVVASLNEEESPLNGNPKSVPAQSSITHIDNGVEPKQPRKGLEPISKPNIQTAEERLYNHLFKDASSNRKRVRPVLNHKTAVTVRFGVCLISLDEIIEKEQTMQSTGCIKMKWTNELLQWDPAEFDNLTWMVVPSSEIWLPDVSLVNSPDPFVMTKQSASVELSYTGEIGYYPSGRIVTRCPIQLKYYPFDQQLCQWEFESWAYPIEAMEMLPWNNDPIDTKAFFGNHLWLLTHTGVAVSQSAYDGLNFSSIHFHYVFQRRSMYDSVFSVYPCILMAILQLISHTLPIEYEGRMGLLTALFIGSSVLLASISSSMPKSSDGISVFQFYLVIYSGSLIVSIVETAFYLHIFHRTPVSKVPGMLLLIESFFKNFRTEEIDKLYATKQLKVEIKDMHKWALENAACRNKARLAKSHQYSPVVVNRMSRCSSSSRPVVQKTTEKKTEKHTFYQGVPFDVQIQQANPVELPKTPWKSESSFRNGKVPFRNALEGFTILTAFEHENSAKNDHAGLIESGTSMNSSASANFASQESGSRGCNSDSNEKGLPATYHWHSPKVFLNRCKDDEEISWHSDIEEPCSDAEAETRLGDFKCFLKERNFKYVSKRNRAIQAAEVRALRAVWLEFAARFDKMFFYTLAFVYFITPIVLFVVIPRFQQIPTASGDGAILLQPYNKDPNASSRS